MYLEKIHLLNFKNYDEFSTEFCSQINCIVGENGSGKTNLLDAIYYLSLTKSAFSQSDNQVLKHEKDFFLLNGNYLIDNENVEVKCSLKAGQRKILQLNKNPYERISEHIGKIPIVLIAPDDTELIKNGSEERRKFFDGLIAQLDYNYLLDFIKYNSILKQRNALLKQFSEKNYFDAEMLEVYNNQLLPLGENIHQKRKDFIGEFVPVFRNRYLTLSESREEVDLTYVSELFEKNFHYNFFNNYKKDIKYQRTLMGVHKDDFVFEIDKFSLKKYGSQGQQKSFVIALKLAQFEFIKIKKKVKPILLLDDIFDKLDERRIHEMMNMIADRQFGQIFVTDARPERTEKIFEKISAEIRIFHTSK